MGAAGQEGVYGVEANFPADQVAWSASGGELERVPGGVRWRPPQRRGLYVLQAAVDAGDLGIAVDTLAIVVD